jgi:phosphate transport system permease protein
VSVLRRRSSLFARGEPLVWLTGAALVLCIFMIVGLLALVVYQGSATFWPKPVTRVETVDGARFMGEMTEEESYQVPDHVLAALPEEARREVEDAGGESVRRLYRTGNYKLTNTHFTWASDFEVKERGEPEWAVLLERLQWGRFYGFPKEFRIDGEAVATEPAAIWSAFEKYHDPVRERWERQRELETDETGEVNERDKDARLEMREAELDYGKDSPQYRDAQEEYKRVQEEVQKEWARIRAEIDELKAENARYELVLETADGRERVVELAEIVRAYLPNQLSWGGKVGIYFSRWWEFLADDPREANQEGGVFPAIFGTVVMTLIMSILVVPFGVLAALYLREYAKQGTLVSIVRIAVNNLAGVPSIVFGVFGLGFFCYIIGSGIDEFLFRADLPNPTFGKGGLMWASLTLALLTLPVVIVATEEALSAVPNSMREGSYACGASKWQTIRNIVLPRAMPGIMTGMVLAIARGAGEVAPLMLVGAVKLAPELPVDGSFPFVHAQRSFMHLGFHIYDLGFQSPNSEAAKPMVYTTTLLLIAIVISLNILAIRVRARLRRKFEAG